ncbi:MAG: helix-hairpin-helix domain-containing protein [Pseudomonadota bacterium]
MLTPLAISLIAIALFAGLAVGWLLRGRRTRDEKQAITETWREQLDIRDSEHKRLVEQNQTLMAQIQTLKSSSDQRSDELRAAQSSSEALGKRFEKLQQSHNRLTLKNQELESAAGKPTEGQAARIEWLESELEKWQERLPPLIEKFRERNADAERLERQLEEAEHRLRLHEAQPSYDETRFDPVKPGDLDGIDDASNQPLLQVVANDAVPVNVSLTDLKGIGPAIDRTLRENGIESVDDLLAMSEEDIETLSEHIKGLANKHPKWAEQARELLADEPGT